MANQEQLRGHWNEVTGRLKEQWGNLTDDDLRRGQGSADQLIGVVQQKTGAAKAEIEAILNSIFDGSISQKAADAVEQYAAAAQTAAADAAAYARDNYKRIAAQSGEYGAKIAETVRTRPGESLAIAFGLGIAAGALLFTGRKR